jgi:hypothetical protein
MDGEAATELAKRGVVRAESKRVLALSQVGMVVRAGAAVPFKKLVYDAVERGFEGLEFGEGIPGSLGGGLTMNAGAFGGEIGRIVERLEGVHAEGRVEEDHVKYNRTGRFNRFRAIGHDVNPVTALFQQCLNDKLARGRVFGDQSGYYKHALVANPGSAEAKARGLC